MTQIVRIAIAINHLGEWSAVGWSNAEDDAKKSVALDTFDGHRSQKLHVHYIEAEVPVPAREEKNP